MTPFAKQVYRSDSAFMLTDVLKGTFTSPTAPDGDLAWKMICPLPENRNHKQQQGYLVLRLHPLLHSRRLGGLRYPP